MMANDPHASTSGTPAGAADADDEIEETLNATVAPGKAPPALSNPEVKEGYDPGRYQDATRSYIAYWLLALLSLSVLGGFGLIFVIPGGATFDNLKSILELIVSPIIALVSAATGFYFGAQQPASDHKS